MFTSSRVLVTVFKQKAVIIGYVRRRMGLAEGFDAEGRRDSLFRYRKASPDLLGRLRSAAVSHSSFH
jgi:hypothetical protein